MRLICNVCLSESDKKVIENYALKIQEDFVVDLANLQDELMKDHLKCLGWMLKNSKLEMKIAVVEGKKGIQHEKIGILQDSQGNVVSFVGSENETWMGWLGNNEKFHVFKSWNEGEKAHLQTDIEDFDSYWNNKAKRAQVYPITQAVKDSLIQIAPKDNEEFLTLSKTLAERLLIGNREIFGSKPSFQEWAHKKEAINIFLSKKHGLIQMATGTGKTSVAIGILNQLLSEEKIDGAIITTFGNDLLDQWYFELSEKANVDLAIYRYYDKWHEIDDFLINNQGSILLTSWVNLERLLKDNSKVKSKLLIVDEVHGFGALSLREKLTGKLKQIEYRLGLSATSEREYDDEGNQFIQDEIGSIIFEFKLEDAIKKGILCEFDYIPLEYELSDEDKQALQAAYKAYSGRLKQGQSERAGKKQLFMDLANVRKVSKNKLPIFRDFISTHPEYLQNCIIFVETMEYGEMVQEIIMNRNPNFHTYYHDDEKTNLDKFASGELSLLLTCKRLSQGIDIRSVRNIIMFSAARGQLETIQRIGRCLRTDPKNPQKKAAVIDFIVKKGKEKPADYDDADEVREEWLTNLSKTRREAV